VANIIKLTILLLRVISIAAYTMRCAQVAWTVAASQRPIGKITFLSVAAWEFDKKQDKKVGGKICHLRTCLSKIIRR